MWYVYNRQDTWQCGWEVETESEAIEFCNDDNELTYCYVG